MKRIRKSLIFILTVVLGMSVLFFVGVRADEDKGEQHAENSDYQYWLQVKYDGKDQHGNDSLTGGGRWRNL